MIPNVKYDIHNPALKIILVGNPELKKVLERIHFFGGSMENVSFPEGCLLFLVRRFASSAFLLKVRNDGNYSHRAVLLLALHLIQYILFLFVTFQGIITT